MDTPIVNGTAYPYLDVEPKIYRFRILNAGDDRFWNLQLYQAYDPATGAVGVGKEVKMVPAAVTPGFPADWPTDGREGGVPDPATMGPSFIQIGTEGGFLPAPVVIPNQPVTWNLDPTTFNFGNVDKHSLLLGTAERADVIVDFSQYAGKTLILYNDAPAAFPALDARYDYYTGDPDRTDTGGAPSTQPGYGPNIRTIMQIRVSGTPGSLSLGSINLTAGGNGYTAPTVDVVGGGASQSATAVATGVVDRIALNTLGAGYTSPVVDITGGGGSGATATATVTEGVITGIKLTSGGSGYASAPAVTITDTTGTGATAKATLTVTGITLANPGAGYTSVPVVAISDPMGTGGGASAFASLLDPAAPAPYDLAALESVFAKTDTKRGVFEASQDEIIVPSADYNSAYNSAFPADPLVRQDQNSHTFQTVSGSTVTLPLQPKAIQDEMGEAYDTEYGRMSGMLGLELPFTVAGAQNFMLYPYGSPPVEIVKGSVYGTPIGSLGDGTQIWKITHNGVDTHTIHTHLYNAQLINRIAWDGSVIPPDPNELGWKETFRVNPLEHTIIAFRPILPTNLPFQVPNSVRLIDPTMPEGDPLKAPPGGFSDPIGEPVTIVNHYVNFGWEYVYHCHLLAHEEMDMMHAVILAVAPEAPSNLVAMVKGGKATLTWTDNSLNETSFTVQRANTAAGPWTTLATLPPAVGTGSTVTYTDASFKSNQTPYYYRVFASNLVGDTQVYPVPSIGFPNMSADSAPVMVGPPAGTTTLVSVTQAAPTKSPVLVTWTYTPSGDQTGFTIQRATNAAFTTGLTTFKVGANVVSYSDTSTKAATTYYYRVAASNDLGNGSWSNSLSITPHQ
jgi:hypothetical protein